MPRVFIDSGILILASQAQEDDIAQRALEELNRDVTYLYSQIIELETVPQPTIHARANQLDFLRAFFESAEKVECSVDVQTLALNEACKGPAGLSAADALHVACAISGGADELVTTESARKPLPQATGVIVRTIRVD